MDQSALVACLQLLDKHAIIETLYRYCRSVDRGDRRLLESVYWPEATENHGNYVGPASGFIEYALEKLANIRTQHRLSNILIELDGENYARSESYVHAHHEAETRFGGEHFIVGARYLDLFEKRDEQWRIRERTMVLDHCGRMATTDVPGMGYFGNARVIGSKYPDDSVYGLLVRSD